VEKQGRHLYKVTVVAGLLAVYASIALLSVGLAALQGLPPRPFLDELSSALAMAGFAMLLMEFVISGRFRKVSRHIGIDLTMRFHQIIARVLTGLLLLHPFLYTLPMTTRGPQDAERTLYLGLTMAGTASGLLAWTGLVFLFAMAVLRDRMGFKYEGWRLGHGLGAGAIAIFGFHHTLDVGRYSQDAYSLGFWLVAVAVSLLALLTVYVLRPLHQMSCAYRVATVARCADRTWTVGIEPSPGRPGFSFEAGQFVWLKFHKAFPRITEQESGDFTSAIGSLERGTPAYVDGPHGNFTLKGRSGHGLAFVAGGVGIAPVLSLLRQLAADSDRRPMLLVYGNRVEAQIACAEELAQLQRSLDLQVFHVLSEPPENWKGLTGQCDGATLERCLPAGGRDQWLYFVCGPTAMIDSTEDFLARAGVPLAQIVAERFRYDSGRQTVRERLMKAVCAATTLFILFGALFFALR
jgi:predicted ferric reductase